MSPAEAVEAESGVPMGAGRNPLVGRVSVFFLAQNPCQLSPKPHLSPTLHRVGGSDILNEHFAAERWGEREAR
jgi:hypothetical protein